MPSKLKKVLALLDPNLMTALEQYAQRSGRSLSNSVSILLEQALLMTGDLKVTIDRTEKRGGKRSSSDRQTEGAKSRLMSRANEAIDPDDEEE